MVRNSAIAAYAPEQALRNDAQQGCAHHERFNAHFVESGDGAGGVVAVQGLLATPWCNPAPEDGDQEVVVLPPRPDGPVAPAEPAGPNLREGARRSTSGALTSRSMATRLRAGAAH